jgi:hypothetical protein
MLKQRLMWTAWPSFLMAGVLEIAVFGLVDPEELKWFGVHYLTESRQAIYTFSFFVFWFIAMLSSSMTLLLSLPPIKPPPDEI